MNEDISTSTAVAERESDRARIAAETEAFLRRGGKVTVVPADTSRHGADRDIQYGRGVKKKNNTDLFGGE